MASLPHTSSPEEALSNRQHAVLVTLTAGCTDVPESSTSSQQGDCSAL